VAAAQVNSERGVYVRIGRREAMLRGRAGAEEPRRAADGCRLSCEPGRWRGHAASLGMPAQAAS